MKRFFLLLALVYSVPLWAQEGTTLNDQARFLAGLPVRGTPLDAYSHDRLWVDHATELDAMWGRAEKRQLQNVRAWAHLNVPGSGGTGTMYYMFSGPDILYANAFFPNASTYILCGTEPVGAVPDITKIRPEHLSGALQSLRGSMATVLRFHYFITKDMRVDLNRSELGGTLPILYVFLVRSGYTVREVAYVSTPSEGVRITINNGGRDQTVYYFKTDLSNGGGSSRFLKWCAEQGRGMSLLKAASYLLHSDSFSGVRRFLLQNSQVIVQDDSGIPYRDFRPNEFTLRLYGDFTGPIELFAKNQQPDLVQAFGDSHPPPLGFAFGYHWQLASGMAMVAVHR